MRGGGGGGGDKRVARVSEFFSTENPDPKKKFGWRGLGTGVIFFGGGGEGRGGGGGRVGGGVGARVSCFFLR